MEFDRVAPIVAAVLYEGYILYPYGPNAIKNRQRWTFGGVFPRDYVEASGGDPDTVQAQCLVEGGPDTMVEFRLRFLHIVAREVMALDRPAPVPALEVDGTRYLAWEEAAEREIAPPATSIAALLDAPIDMAFTIAASGQREPIHHADGLIAGALVRTACALSGRLMVPAERVADGVFRLTVRAGNVTPLAPAERTDRTLAQRYRFASTHLLLGATDGAFVSLMEPPPHLAEAAAGCDNQGVWPVLVGAPDQRAMMLAAPIILYDYPRIADESPGDLFDGTEIDEILSLRILTMTDAEKRDMAAADARGRALLERTERLGAPEFARMHGAMRPAFAVGEHVRLRPRRRADIMDVVLADKVAVIEAIERDFENRIHLAVTLLDDPAVSSAWSGCLGIASFSRPTKSRNWRRHERHPDRRHRQHLPRRRRIRRGGRPAP